LETITFPLTINAKLLITFAPEKTHNFRVVMVGDFNTPALTENVACSCQIPSIILNLREKRCNPTCVFLNLTTTLILSAAATYLISFLPTKAIYILFVDPGFVMPDSYHRPFIINIYLPFATCIQIKYIRTVISRLEIMICFILFSRPMTFIFISSP
jgi:hypothetical protein